MASAALSGKTIAILAAGGFEQVEMTQPRDGNVTASQHEKPGDVFAGARMRAGAGV